MKKKDQRITNSPKKPEITVNTAMSNINQSKYYPGDSVEKLKRLEEANTIITGDEIIQQNENL
ncbi:hypothetical protein ACQKP0_18175 [Heyndrickxia sp. NPDC080065]|uniref:hypothetical protein n=1 Tax=Heyndrickxia sp. NPDC080065 TaxID=3390568 RepID=UPI003D08A4A5